jgi:hypothetical protein
MTSLRGARNPHVLMYTAVPARRASRPSSYSVPFRNSLNDLKGLHTPER